MQEVFVCQAPVNPRWMIESGVSNHLRGDAQPDTSAVQQLPSGALGETD